jgi:Collagen triple helix repeat (20 copies)
LIFGVSQFARILRFIGEENFRRIAMTQLRKILWLVAFAAALLLLPGGAWAQSAPATDDATIQLKYPTTNDGSSSNLGVLGPNLQEAFIRFDLSVLPSGLQASNVNKATLRLFLANLSVGGTFDVRLVTGIWSEKTLTYNIAPPAGLLIAGSVPTNTSEGRDFILVDVTSAVQAWLSGTANDGIVLAASPGSSISVNFDSKENSSTSHDPEIEIEVVSVGPQGAQGPAGTAATIQVGQVTTGGPGSAASVSNVGSQTAAVLNFTIPQGPTGLTGPQGPQGAQGPQGVKGDTGATGPQGIQGVKGDTGLQGIQGVKGDTGLQGIQGVKGDTGLQGIQGVKGDTGPQGIQGVKGDLGLTGPQGPAGPAGPSGSGSLLSHFQAFAIPGPGGTFVVPAGITVVQIEAVGAGGRGDIGGGGSGGYNRAVLSVTPGSTYTVTIGVGDGSGSEVTLVKDSSGTSVACGAGGLSGGGLGPGIGGQLIVSCPDVFVLEIGATNRMHIDGAIGQPAALQNVTCVSLYACIVTVINNLPGSNVITPGNGGPPIMFGAGAGGAGAAVGAGQNGGNGFALISW